MGLVILSDRVGECSTFDRGGSRVRRAAAAPFFFLRSRQLLRGDSLGAYGAATTKVIDPGGALARGELTLGNIVRIAANTQAVIDCFVVIGIMTAVALIIVVIRSAAPEGPASPMSLFRRRGPSPP